jgi:hypothetical protein
MLIMQLIITLKKCSRLFSHHTGLVNFNYSNRHICWISVGGTGNETALASRVADLHANPAAYRIHAPLMTHCFMAVHR